MLFHTTYNGYNERLPTQDIGMDVEHRQLSPVVTGYVKSLCKLFDS